MSERHEIQQHEMAAMDIKTLIARLNGIGEAICNVKLADGTAHLSLIDRIVHVDDYQKQSNVPAINQVKLELKDRNTHKPFSAPIMLNSVESLSWSA